MKNQLEKMKEDIDGLFKKGDCGPGAPQFVERPIWLFGPISNCKWAGGH